MRPALALSLHTLDDALRAELLPRAPRVASPRCGWASDCTAARWCWETSARRAGASTPPSATAAPSGLPELLTPAQAAEALGVSEADVMQSLEGGDLKGKKIGSSYRITRAALNEFLQH